MRKLSFFTSALATLALLFIAAPASAQTQAAAACPAPDQARADVERTIRNFFSALRGEGDVRFEELTTSSMYSFDVGERFEGSSLAEVIIEALADGVEITWNLGPMDTKVRCDIAWSAWENTGSAGTPPDIRPVRWLESAVLVYEDARWKVDFFHSQRARGE